MPTCAGTEQQDGTETSQPLEVKTSQFRNGGCRCPLAQRHRKSITTTETANEPEALNRSRSHHDCDRCAGHGAGSCSKGAIGPSSAGSGPGLSSQPRFLAG